MPLLDVFAMHEHVLDKENATPDHVILSGDSTGEWFSLAIYKKLRGEGQDADLSLACLLYSPLADDAYLAGLEGEARKQTSTVIWDLTDLPPMFVQYGAFERFYEQCMHLKAIADKQGVTNWELGGYATRPAKFPTNVLSFAKETICHACVFAAKQFAPVLETEPEPEHYSK